jgi:hypothetical protein
MTTADQASSIPTSRKVLCVVHGVIAVAALIGTWSHIGPYLHSFTDFVGTLFRDTKATPASRVVTVDALMLSVSVAILMVIEARKYNVRFVWAYIAAGFFVAVRHRGQSDRRAGVERSVGEQAATLKGRSGRGWE